MHDIYAKKDKIDKKVVPNPSQPVSQENPFIYDFLESPESISYTNEDPRQRANNPSSQRVTDRPQNILNPFNQEVADPPLQRIPDPIPRATVAPSQRIIDPVPQIINPALQNSIEPPKLLITEDENLDSLTRFVQAKLQDIPRTPHDNFYVAAVIDFQPMVLGDIGTKVRWNVDQYIEVIRECEKYVSFASQLRRNCNAMFN